MTLVSLLVVNPRAVDKPTKSLASCPRLGRIALFERKGVHGTPARRVFRPKQELVPSTYRIPLLTVKWVLTTTFRSDYSLLPPSRVESAL